MRIILKDDLEYQVQGDGRGVEYHYRKDYLYKGDMEEEYSLVLLWSKRSVDLSGALELSIKAEKDARYAGENIRPGFESELPVLPEPENP
jgi:hypothetical protein